MLTGKNLINGTWQGSKQTITSGDLANMSFAQATLAQVEAACLAARRDFRGYAATSGMDRAIFLRTIAHQMDILGDEITKIGCAETSLPEARLNSERGRTTKQLLMFADLIEDDKHLDTRIDAALPGRMPMPRSDLRLTHRPIGPIVVFGASNFPLAFSTAGGDTASALAAGCPVIVKGHGAHAGTGELVGQAIAKAIEICGMPVGTFQMLQGPGRVIGNALVQHPEIRGVGFTGSFAGGKALYDICHSRSHPIPFYGELSSVNPVFLLPQAIEKRAAVMGASWVESLIMGAGQFCTNPGIVVGVRGTGLDIFAKAALTALKDAPEQKMLTDGIHEAYQKGVLGFAELMEEISTCGRSDKPRHTLPVVFKIDAGKWMSTPRLQHEIFGAAGVLVECEDVAQMVAVAEAMEGQLTATLHLEDGDTELANGLVVVLEEKAGRLLCNGFPTGVEVCSAMMHGGPYPASTDARVTSVGTLAIARWLRPVSYQDFPKALLHPELRIIKGV
jgi:alpha-ketoglutaric semialdehyde dehydrogenase